MNPAVERLIRFTPSSLLGKADPLGLLLAKQNSICVSAPDGCVLYPFVPSILLKSSLSTSICD